MLQTKLLPASMCVTVAIVLLTGLYFNGRVDAESDERPASDRNQETFLDRAVRTRAGELLKRVDTESLQECSCQS
ncbi:MAG: hypothetical protein Q8L60_14490 [Gammaproteobacteria bacterium]|nr:hypothetical protein [Gammaproteobacteria bacterium]MDP2139607.1 hypothetical protein [Gammaproteobacteria bacterium]MDP2346580.1 hypothetical protein [Gammaproteobacteria bacterium]